MYSNLDIINYNLIKNLFKEENKYFFCQNEIEVLYGIKQMVLKF